MQTLERVGDFPFLFSTYSAAPEKPRWVVDGEKFPHGDGKRGVVSEVLRHIADNALPSTAVDGSDCLAVNS